MSRVRTEWPHVKMFISQSAHSSWRNLTSSKAPCLRTQPFWWKALHNCGQRPSKQVVDSLLQTHFVHLDLPIVFCIWREMKSFIRQNTVDCPLLRDLHIEVGKILSLFCCLNNSSSFNTTDLTMIVRDLVNRSEDKWSQNGPHQRMASCSNSLFIYHFW